MTNEYEVGYGKPPKKHQFKPGYSGNKKGRPKGRKNIHTIVENLMNEKIKITINGRTKKVSCIEATIRQVSLAALKGDIKAQRILFDLISKYTVRQEDLLQGNEEMQQEDIQLLNEMMEQYARGEEIDESRAEAPMVSCTLTERL